MSKKFKDKKNYFVVILCCLILLIGLNNCTKTETKSIADNKTSNNLPNNIHVEEKQVVAKTNLIAYGKWAASESDENFNYLTYQVTETDPVDGERMMTLRIFDFEDKEIYKEDFNTIHTIYPMYLLYDGMGEQLVIGYNLGGSGTDLKILTLRNNKIENIVEDDRIHVNGDISFIPTSINRMQQNKPIQILEIGADKIIGENRKLVRVFRFKDNKYRFDGSAYYEDFLKCLNNAVKENGSVPKENLLRR